MPTYDHLVRLYAGGGELRPNRHYHTLEHVRHCLEAFDDVRALARDADAVEAALWFHDAVYSTQSQDGSPVTDNEALSAWVANERLRWAGVSENFRSRVADLIVDGTRHGAVPTEHDAKIVSDIDLGILGQPARVFDRYDAQIRQEYDWVPEDAYRAGRAKVLRSFLDRPTIYLTEFFRVRLELPARANIIRALAKLGE